MSDPSTFAEMHDRWMAANTRARVAEKEIERLRGLLMDMPWHVVEAAEVDDSIAEWFRRRDDLLFGGDKP